MNRADKYRFELIFKRLEEQTKRVRELECIIDKDIPKLGHTIDSMSGIIRKNNKLLKILGIPTNISMKDVRKMEGNIMRTVANEELRDTIRVLCMIGVDYYEIVNTLTDTVVEISREREQADRICAEYNKDSINYKVNFINN